MPQIIERNEKGQIVVIKNDDTSKINLGNNNALKFKTSKERKEVFKKLLEHYRKGKISEAFALLSHQCFDYYCEIFPEDWDKEQMEEAKREGIGKFMEIGDNAMEGKNPKCAVAVWIFEAKHRLGWYDKSENNNTNTNININLNDLLNVENKI